MTSGIDERRGKELGLKGRFADVPAYQIIDDVQNRFLSLKARLIWLERSSSGEAYKKNPMWGAIDMEMSGIANRLSKIGGDALRGATLSEEIVGLDQIVNLLVSDVCAETQFRQYRCFMTPNSEK